MNANEKDTKVIILVLTEHHIKCQFLHSHASIGNALRRIITAELPFYAIDEVVLEENTSRDYHDLICQRISLLPLVQNQCEDIEEEENPKKYKFLLQTQEKKTTTVFSSSIPLSFLPNVPIIELRDEEKVNGYITVKKGIGREHAKFMPHTSCRSYPEPIITLLTNQVDWKLLQKVCPRGVFDNDMVDVSKCTYCQECVNLKQVNVKQVDIKANESCFFFELQTLENTQALTVLRQAIDIMLDKLAWMEQSLIGIKSQHN